MEQDSISNKIILVRNQPVILDRDVAKIYGVETRIVNQAVRNNPAKFPSGYLYQLDPQEVADLKSKFLISSNTHGGTRKPPIAFTEKGLYMLATILKGPIATEASIEIIETFAKVREMQRDLVALHRVREPETRKNLMSRFSDRLSDIVMPELRPEETETSLELNFIIGKLKHTVKRRRAEKGDDIIEEPEVQYGEATE